MLQMPPLHPKSLQNRLFFLAICFIMQEKQTNELEMIVSFSLRVPFVSTITFHIILESLAVMKKVLFPLVYLLISIF